MNKFKKVVALLLAFVMTLSLSLTAFAANDLGITYSAEVVSVDGQTVVMEIKASEKVFVDTVSANVITPDGWTISAIENADLIFTTQDYNGDIIAWMEPNAEAIETDLLAKITYTMPADFAGPVTLGVTGIYLTNEYCSNEWEIDGEAKVEYSPVPVCDHADTKYVYDEENHWKVCANEECNAVIEGTTAPHVFEGATCTADGTCECGATGGKLDHDYATPKYDEDNHWNECVCGEKSGVAAHECELEGDVYKCACGYEYDAPKYTVEFLGYKGNVVYTATAIVGFEISAGDIAAAEAAVAATAPYGYVFVGFDSEIPAEEGTVDAKFSQADVKYTVNIIGLTGEATKSLKFDTALTVTEPNVAAWKVNGVIVAAGESVTLYVAGDMTIEAVEEAPAESSIAIIGKADNGKATVMVKAYIAGAVEYKTGVDYTLGGRTVTVYSKNNTAIDFMTGLNNAPAGIEAKAFIEIDGVKTYSAAETF